MRKKGKILIIEDDAGVRESLRLVLKRDYEVFVAENGAKALELLEQTSVDTVTLEPWLPGVQGREVFEHIRRASPKARVIIVSGHRLGLWFDDMVREEVFDYLPKPFDNRDLLKAIERSLVRTRPVFALTS